MSILAEQAIALELLNAPKKLATQELTWRENPTSDQQASIKSGVAIENEIKGNLFFHANARVYNGTHLTVDLILSYYGDQIERMSFNPHAPHTNKFFPETPKTLKGIVLPAFQSRYYSWENNKNFGFPPKEKHYKNLQVGVIITPQILEFQEAVNYFFTQTNIECVPISEPPFKQLSLV
jgi:hypothetical protein